MSKVEIIDRAEERRLLDAWFETTSFDKPSKGVPKLSKDEGDDEDETKDGTGGGNYFEYESKVRHVRTPAGVRRYGQPIGTIIVAGSPLRNLTIRDRVYTGWERVSDSHGNEYDVGKRGNRWIATRAGEWDELEWGGSADEVFRALDARAGRSGGTAVPRPRASRTPAPTVAAAAPSRPKSTTNYTREESDDPNYEKYKGADGKTYWAVQDEASKEWVLLDDNDNELDSSKSKAALLKKLNAHAAAPEAPATQSARTPRAARTPAAPAPNTPAAQASTPGPSGDEARQAQIAALEGRIQSWGANSGPGRTARRELRAIDPGNPLAQPKTSRTASGAAWSNEQGGAKWDTLRGLGLGVGDEVMVHGMDRSGPDGTPQRYRVSSPRRGLLTFTNTDTGKSMEVGSATRMWFSRVPEGSTSTPKPKGSTQDRAASVARQAPASGDFVAELALLNPSQRSDVQRYIDQARNGGTGKNSMGKTPAQWAASSLGVIANTSRYGRTGSEERFNAIMNIANAIDPTERAIREREAAKYAARYGPDAGKNRPTTRRENDGIAGSQVEPKRTEKVKPYQLAVGMRVRMTPNAFNSDAPLSELDKPQWFTIGMIGREQRTGMWSGSRASTSGMYHIYDTRGKYLGTASPNSHIVMDSDSGPRESDRARATHVEGDRDAQVLLPSERARRELGMPEPMLDSYGKVRREDPNYGYPALAQQIQNQLDNSERYNYSNSHVVELTIQKSRYMLDKDEAVRELTALMHKTSDARDVEKLQKRIRALQPDGPLLSAGQAARPGNPNSGAASRAEANMNRQQRMASIRNAWQAVAMKNGNAWVSMADLRDATSGQLSRAEFDEVIRDLARGDSNAGAQVEEETNQKTLTERDRAAAVTLGGRPMHIVSFGSLPRTAQDTEQRAAAARTAATRNAIDFSTLSAAELDTVISSGTLSQAEEAVARAIYASRSRTNPRPYAGYGTDAGMPERMRNAVQYRRSVENMGRNRDVISEYNRIINEYEVGRSSPEAAAQDLRALARRRGLAAGAVSTARLVADSIERAHSKSTFATEVKDFIDGFEEKAVRYVRTRSGEQRFGQPIGSIIVRDGASPLSNLRAVAGNRLQGSDGTRYRIGQANGRWEARADGGNEAVVHGDSEEQLLTRLNNHAADNATRPSGNSPTSGDSANTDAPTRQPDKDHAQHGEAYKAADGKIYYIKGEDDEYVVRDSQGNEIRRKRDKGRALAEIQRFAEASGPSSGDDETPASGGGDEGNGPTPNAPTGSAPSGAGGNGPVPNTPANQQAIARQLARMQTSQLRAAARRNGLPAGPQATREGLISSLLKFLVRKLLGRGNQQQPAPATQAAYGALLELKEMLEDLEEKIRHVRTAAGAARYGVPIGSPIPAGGKPALGAGINSKPKRAKLSPEMRSHREGFNGLHKRLMKKPETQGMAGSVMSLIEQIDAGEITNEDQLMGVVARLFTPDQFGLLLANVKSFDFATEVKTLIDVKADKQEHTGAMIALIPTREDARRLVAKEGEDQDELHVTLAFLGKAADISESARYAIIGRIAGLAGNAVRPGAEAFAVNVFNPNGEDPCVVMGINGKGPALNDLHNHTMMALGDVESSNNWQMPEQHTPWIPHITLRYFKDGEEVDADWLMEQFDKTGPVEFDRIRVAFGGNNIDFPLYDGMVKGEKKLVITPGGRVGDDSSRNLSPRDNWVDKRGGLPKYIRTIANGIREKRGTTEGRAIALAVSAVKRWASGRGNVSPAVRAAAAKAVAEWEAMKGTKGIGGSLPSGSAGVGAAPAKKPAGNYVADRMAEGGRIAGAARQSMSHDPSFNDKHPRGRGAQGGQFVRKNGDTAQSLSNAMKKRLPISYGQQGPVVKQVQMLVGKMGFPTEEDGIFGEKTKAAVKAAQKKLGLKATGVIDEETMTALLSNAKPSKRKS